MLIKLGKIAYKHRDYEDAISYLQAARDELPDHAGLSNNIAWILSEHEPRDLEKALQYATHAIHIEPANPVFRDTRGRILARAGKMAVIDHRPRNGGQRRD